MPFLDIFFGKKKEARPATSLFALMGPAPLEPVEPAPRKKPEPKAPKSKKARPPVPYQRRRWLFFPRGTAQPNLKDWQAFSIQYNKSGISPQKPKRNKSDLEAGIGMEVEPDLWENEDGWVEVDWDEDQWMDRYQYNVPQAVSAGMRREMNLYGKNPFDDDSEFELEDDSDDEMLGGDSNMLHQFGLAGGLGNRSLGQRVGRPY